MSDRELGERMARMEGLLESHEKNALERRASIEKRFDVIAKKLDDQQCVVHAARMLQIQKDLDVVLDEKIPFLERAYWIGVGALSVLTFCVPLVMRVFFP